MPNHYTTTLYFDGDLATDLAAKMNSTDGGLCEYVMPMPAEVRNAPGEAWYHWALTNWGTKWGTYDHTADGGQLRFSSAWGPPLDAVFQELANVTGLSFSALGYDEFADPEEEDTIGSYFPEPREPEQVEEDI